MPEGPSWGCTTSSLVKVVDYIRAYTPNRSFTRRSQGDAIPTVFQITCVAKVILEQDASPCSYLKSAHNHRKCQRTPLFKPNHRDLPGGACFRSASGSGDDPKVKVVSHWGVSVASQCCVPPCKFTNNHVSRRLHACMHINATRFVNSTTPPILRYMCLETQKMWWYHYGTMHD